MADKVSTVPDVSNLIRGSLLYWVAGGGVYDRRVSSLPSAPICPLKLFKDWRTTAKAVAHSTAIARSTVIALVGDAARPVPAFTTSKRAARLYPNTNDMNRAMAFIGSHLKTDPEKFGYWQALSSLLLTPFDNQQRKFTRPPPKPVAATQNHATTAKPAEVEVKMASPEESKQASDGKPGKNGQGGDKKQGKVDLTFTAEEDATLLEMKHKGDSWKQIAQALKKPQGAIKNRFKEIAPDDLQDAVAGKGIAGKSKDAPAKKDNAQQKPKNNSEKKQSNDKGSSAKSNDSSKSKKDDQSVRSSSSVAKISIPQYINGLETITLRPDETFDAESLVWLCDAFMRDNDERFIRLSSRYYDMTGRRIHPATIRDKLMRSGFAV